MLEDPDSVAVVRPEPRRLPSWCKQLSVRALLRAGSFEWESLQEKKKRWSRLPRCSGELFRLHCSDSTRTRRNIMDFWSRPDPPLLKYKFSDATR